MAQVFQHRALGQPGRETEGAFAMYLEPWHADIMSFVDLRRNGGSSENRTRDLFLALWVPDLFMRRVEAAATGASLSERGSRLTDVWRVRRAVRALRAGGYRDPRAAADEPHHRRTDRDRHPYFLYKDSANQKSNQRHLRVIKSSNLCAEIIEYSSARRSRSATSRLHSL
jgi:ribonucleotide reductase alpha subunit